MRWTRYYGAYAGGRDRCDYGCNIIAVSAVISNWCLMWGRWPAVTSAMQIARLISDAMDAMSLRQSL